MHKNTPEKIKQARRAIKHKIVETHQYTTAKKSLDSMKHFAGLQSIGLILLAETGLGKSTILDKFIINNIASITAEVIASVDYDFTPVPIIMFEMPSEPTIKSVCKAILKQANHPDLTGTGDVLKDRVEALFEYQLVRYLIIDECQHLLREQAGRRTTTTLNFIKGLMNDYNIVVITAGIPTAETALTEYAELEERLGYKKCYITEFSIDSDAGIENFGSFLTGFDELFSVLEINICKLYSEDMFERIFLACAGSPRKFKYILYKVLSVSEDLAFESKINKQMFAKAYADMPYNTALEKFNPFSATVEKVSEKLLEWDNIKLKAHLKTNKKKKGK